MRLIAMIAALTLAAGSAALLLARESRRSPQGEQAPEPGYAKGGTPATDRALEKASFAGGCFWCMEEAFEKVPGVVSVISGYTGGRAPNPTYEEVSSGGTGHAESVDVVYDPTRVTYEDLLRVFWHNVDPTTPNRQFCDVGEQYRSAIFYRNEEQRRLAEASKQEVERTKTFQQPILTEIVPASEFYPAEDYHQDYYKKNPVRYKFYKYNCGRAQRLEQLWGKHS
jgi:peptide-methionine (S)-S-oxide reductase